VKLRTADHAPATPLTLTPRTRQNCVAVASPVVAYIDEAIDRRAADAASHAAARGL
jgi:hypothetical protein